MKKQTKSAWIFRFLRYLVWLFYPKMKLVGSENLPDEPVIIIGNHAQMNGPIVCELYMPDNCYIWCAGQMMNLRDIPSYAYADFWSQKPKWARPFFKLLSYIIAPLCVVIFNNARTIAVYKDKRVLHTFRETVSKLQAGNSVVIFPEHDTKYNHIVYDFQEGFVSVAKLYHKRTGKEISFVPLYIAPKLKKAYLGTPVKFNASAPIEDERHRICDCLKSGITDLASSLPKHTVIPYRNIPRKLYPQNLPKEAGK